MLGLFLTGCNGTVEGITVDPPKKEDDGGSSGGGNGSGSGGSGGGNEDPSQKEKERLARLERHAALLGKRDDLAIAYAQQRETVFRVLDELGAADRPILEALNKADAARVGGMIEPADAILISAKNGDGLEKIKAEISRRIAALRHRAELTIPYDKGNVLSLIHQKGQVLSEEYTAEGTRVVAMMDAALYQRVLGVLGNRE